MARLTKVTLSKALRQKATKMKHCDYCDKVKPKYWVTAEGRLSRNVMREPNGAWKCFNCSTKSSSQ